jgi:hypothetical protein
VAIECAAQPYCKDPVRALASRLVVVPDLVVSAASWGVISTLHAGCHFYLAPTARSRRFCCARGYGVIGVFKETGWGAKLDHAERKKVMALAQRREIDARASSQKQRSPMFPIWSCLPCYSAHFMS